MRAGSVSRAAERRATDLTGEYGTPARPQHLKGLVGPEAQRIAAEIPERRLARSVFRQCAEAAEEG